LPSDGNYGLCKSEVSNLLIQTISSCRKSNIITCYNTNSKHETHITKIKSFCCCFYVLDITLCFVCWPGGFKVQLLRNAGIEPRTCRSNIYRCSYTNQLTMRLAIQYLILMIYRYAILIHIL
jgi:hypothetical protein